MCVGIMRIQQHRLLETAPGFIQAAQLGQRRTQIVVRGGLFWRQGQGALITGQRRLVAAGVTQGIAQVAMRAGILRQ